MENLPLFNLSDDDLSQAHHDFKVSQLMSQSKSVIRQHNQQKKLNKISDKERELADNSWVHAEFMKRRSSENVIKIFVIFQCITDKKTRWEALRQFPSEDVKFVQSKFHEDKGWNPIIDR